MSNINIKSTNQSGGITAQNVTSSSTQFTSNQTEQEGKLTKLFWWIFGVAGVIGAAAGVIALLK